MLPDQPAISCHPAGKRVAVGCEPHQLVLAGIDLEAEVVCNRGIQEAERMGKSQFLENRDLIALAVADGSGCPFADTVNGEDGSFPEWGWIEGAGGMGKVVFCKEQFYLFGNRAVDSFKPVHKKLFQEKLLFDPDWNGGDE